ncbi:hypothetical protein DDE18_18065 [Nocardioides gansuensis]|uniref:N,N-dimethylformamidase beta subunit-like C-terminal domain-containing protein n=1 Tax=Nocardioides gansuensis TaxID=2138300 RepID=A0A2T8F6Q3_9ACTN|nr:hypothetical protein DDE18_18065 [Nocardioides gansuensis]
MVSPGTSPGAQPADGSGTGDGVGGARDRRRHGSEAWRITKPSNDHQIEAYTTHASGLPGTRVGLKVSTTERGYEASAFRIGAYRGGTGAFVWESGFRRGRVQPAARLEPARTRTVVAPWRRDLTVDTSTWDPGFYVFTLRTPTGWQTQVPYVVTSPSARGTVALVAPITTWQAYNAWGGYSLYEGPPGDRNSYAVSFDRPYNGATGANDYRTAAIPIIVRAERTGEPLSYFTNVDLHLRSGSLDGALGYVSMGHDEYWTPSMRAEVMAARDAGTNLAFLGANTMYWRVRLEDRATGRARVMVGYRHSAHLDPLRDSRPGEATSRFRDAPVPRPEHDLLGMQYECYPVDADYVVVSPRWWGFRSTGVSHGDRVPGLVGPEADRVYPDRALPRPLQILSHTSYDCRGVSTTAQSVYYTTPSGAGVFTAGTLRWGCSLVDRCDRPLGPATARFVRIVTDNLVTGFARGPVGGRHPARDNVASFDLPTTNLVSAS